MTDRILILLNRLATWKVIVGLVVLLTAFSFFLLPMLANPGGANLPVLDTKFWYTPDQAQEVIARYSPELRRTSITGHLTLDLAFPALYGLLLSLLMIVTFRRARPEQVRQVAFFPWRAALADVLENIGLAVMFAIYPAQFGLLSWITAIFTALKWVQIAFSLLVLLIGVVLIFLNRSKRSV